MFYIYIQNWGKAQELLSNAVGFSESWMFKPKW